MKQKSLLLSTVLKTQDTQTVTKDNIKLHPWVERTHSRYYFSKLWSCVNKMIYIKKKTQLGILNPSFCLRVLLILWIFLSMSSFVILINQSFTTVDYNVWSACQAQGPKLERFPKPDQKQSLGPKLECLTQAYKADLKFQSQVVKDCFCEYIQEHCHQRIPKQ